jgi:hypothetical protein
MPAKIQSYTNSVSNLGGVRDVWGFIDGTMRAICRPMQNQHLYYSGFKKYHAIKFQAVTTPDGLISYLAGPWHIFKGDWGMYMSSGQQQQLRTINAAQNTEERFYLYGDPA